jgi:hypothetical protein
LMPTPTRRSRSGRGLKPVERFIPNIWQRARRRLWLTGSRHRGGMHRGKIVAARRLGNAWEYLFRWEGYGERDDWLKRDLVSRGALQEFRARSRSTKRAVGRARGASSDSAGAAVASASNSVQQRKDRDERYQRRQELQHPGGGRASADNGQGKFPASIHAGEKEDEVAAGYVDAPAEPHSPPTRKSDLCRMPEGSTVDDGAGEVSAGGAGPQGAAPAEPAGAMEKRKSDIKGRKTPLEMGTCASARSHAPGC